MRIAFQSSLAIALSVLPMLACSPPKTVVDQTTKETADDGPEPIGAKIEYEHGDALKYVPASCPRSYGYIDLAAIMRNEGVAANFDTIQRKLTEKLASGKAGEKMSRALDELSAKGVDLLRDPREIAVCSKDKGDLVVVVGGAFSGKDVLGAISSANAASGEGALVRKRIDGVSLVRLRKKGVIAHIAPNVLAIGDDESAIVALKSAPGGGVGWDVGKGRLFLMHTVDKKEEPIDVHVTDKGSELELQFAMEMRGKAALGVKTNPKEFKAEMRKKIDEQADKLERGPFKNLGPHFRRTTIDVIGARVVFRTTVPSGEIAVAIKGAAQANDADLGESF